MKTLAVSTLPRVVKVPGAVLLGLGSILGTGIFVSIGLATESAGSLVSYANRLFSDGHGLETRLPWIALGAVAAVTVLVAGGLKRTNAANAVIVGITITALAALVIAGVVFLGGDETVAIATDLTPLPTPNLFEATALMFVAYTGYGRIATLGEEIHEPRRAIPKAIAITLALACLLTVSVAAVAVGILGPEGLAAATREDAAPLIAVAHKMQSPALAFIVALGAFTAMMGVLVNLLVGLSRVVLAMARRGDLPRGLAHISHGSPRRAVFLVGALIGALVLIGSVKTTWTFSAFTVLVYYAITNLAALALAPRDRMLSPLIPWAGLISCLALAFFVDATIWAAGLAVIALGLVWFAIARLLQHTKSV